MARQRATATELAKLLNASKQPIYVLDEEQTIVFCNQACLDWLGTTPDVLLGRRCRYHTRREATDEELLASNLCPPPKVFTGVAVTDVVAAPAKGGTTGRRRAQFVPLGTDPEANFGILAIVAREDIDDEESIAAPQEETDAAALHDHLRRFRRQAGARYRADRLIGEGPAVRRARAQVELAAGSNAGVLIVGPPGSGRQHLASAIHYGTEPQSAGPLVPLACAVLGADLIRSTILALAARGPAQAGSGRSTLLLNDADQLPAEVQPELARTLGRRTFFLRPIATARIPLIQLAGEDRFSPDLAALLSTVTIELPPLAERLEDLPLLAQMFLEDINAQGTKQVGGFSDEALDLLHAYRWPGNLDELAQVVAEAHRSASGPEIGPNDLPRRIHHVADAAARPRPKQQTIELDRFMAGIERELIERALAQAKGNKTQAAKLLGLSRPRLYRRLVQLGLEEQGAGSEE